MAVGCTMAASLKASESSSAREPEKTKNFVSEAPRVIYGEYSRVNAKQMCRRNSISMSSKVSGKNAAIEKNLELIDDAKFLFLSVNKLTFFSLLARVHTKCR